jgi:hypothetical protein
MSRVRLGAAAACCALVVLGLTAPSALAGRVLYGAPPGAGWTVVSEGNGNGITKITINSCLVAGQAFQLPLSVTADGPYKGAPSAAWKVMQDAGAALTFDPATVLFDTATKTATLTITAPAPNDKGGQLRFKLAPDPGSGLGEGPGYMVHFACVLAPAPAPAPAPVTVPTTGIVSDSTTHAARCIATPKLLRVTAGEHNVVRVTVATNGVKISGALVRLRTPDGVVYHRTGRDGVAVFRVRPSRSGAILVASDVCFGVRRVAVKAARVTSRRVSPRFTG